MTCLYLCFKKSTCFFIFCLWHGEWGRWARLWVGEMPAVFTGRGLWGGWWQRYLRGVMSSCGLDWTAKGLRPWREPAVGSGQASLPLPFKLHGGYKEEDWGGRAWGNLLWGVEQVTLTRGAPFCQTGYFPASQERVLWGPSQMAGMKSTLAIVKHFFKCEVLFLLLSASLYRMWPNNWMTVSGCSRGSNKEGDGL